MKLPSDTPDRSHLLVFKPLVLNPRVRSITDKRDTRAVRTMRRGRSATPQVLVLVVMLLLVLFARYEAGKPENWEWMGFEEQGTATVNESSSDQGSALVADGTASSVARLTEEQRSVEVPRFKSAPTGSTVSKLAQLSEVDPPNDSIDVVPDLDSIKASIETGGNVEEGQVGSGSASASEFWRSILGKMKPEQQSNFLKMLRSIRHSEPLDPEIRQSCASLVRVIGKNRDKYHQALFDRLTLATDGSEEKRKISSDLFESQSVCLLYTSPSPRDQRGSRMPSSA